MPEVALEISPEIREASSLESRVIEVFVRFSRVIGFPRSLAEIYGLLYISESPLPMDEIQVRLQISKGSTSQGLRQLVSFGAIKAVYINGDRRSFYTAETELRQLVSRFIEDQLAPHLRSGGNLVAEIKNQLETGEEITDFQRSRVERLARWQSVASQALPTALKLLAP